MLLEWKDGGEPFIFFSEFMKMAQSDTRACVISLTCQFLAAAVAVHHALR